MANKIILFILTLSNCLTLCAHEYEGRFGIGGHYELENVVRDFLICNDTTAFSKIATAKDTRDFYCFYESEYFMYSLVMALDYDNSFAFSELNRLLHEFYDKNHLVKADFFYDLSIYFKSKGDIFFSDEIINIENQVTSETIMSYSQHFTTPNEYYKDSLLSITNDGDSIAYSHLFERLRHSCYFDSKYNHDKFFRNRMLFFSIYHIDKNHSSEGYLRLYRLIMGFYNTRGKELSKNSSRLALYFLKKAARLGNVTAKNELLRLVEYESL